MGLVYKIRKIQDHFDTPNTNLDIFDRKLKGLVFKIRKIQDHFDTPNSNLDVPTCSVNIHGTTYCKLFSMFPYWPNNRHTLCLNVLKNINMNIKNKMIDYGCQL